MFDIFCLIVTSSVWIFHILRRISKSSNILMFQVDISLAGIIYRLMFSYRPILSLLLISVIVLSLLITLTYVFCSNGKSFLFHIRARVYFICPNRGTSTFVSVRNASTVYNTFFDTSSSLNFIINATNCSVLLDSWYLCLIESRLHAFLFRQAIF